MRTIALLPEHANSNLGRRLDPDVTDHVRFVLGTLAGIDAAQLVTKWNPGSRNVERLRKAAIGAGTTTDPAYAGPLVGLDVLVEAFGALLRPSEILGQLLPFARRVPFNIKIPRQTAGSSVQWVGEGRVTPLAALAFASDDFLHFKLAVLVAVTKELAREGRPDTVALVTQDLIKATAQAVDEALLNPSFAGSPGISPASITHAAPSLVASGTDAVAFKADAAKLIGEMVAAGTSLTAGRWIMSPPQRAALSLLDPALIRDDGTLAGFPVLTTTCSAIATGTAPPVGNIVLVDASELNIGDLGAQIDTSEEALLEMSAPPTDPPTAATVLVSMWQTGLVALRVLRFANWQRTRPGTCGVITGCSYGLA
jgi:hypothetical protein